MNPKNARYMLTHISMFLIDTCIHCDKIYFKLSTNCFHVSDSSMLREYWLKVETELHVYETLSQNIQESKLTLDNSITITLHIHWYSSGKGMVSSKLIFDLIFPLVCSGWDRVFITFRYEFDLPDCLTHECPSRHEVFHLLSVC